MEPAGDEVRETEREARHQVSCSAAAESPDVRAGEEQRAGRDRDEPTERPDQPAEHERTPNRLLLRRLRQQDEASRGEAA
jgi:hypothetical protein